MCNVVRRKKIVFVRSECFCSGPQIEGDIALAVWPMTTAFFAAREYSIV
jgi:hypothetical protein